MIKEYNADGRESAVSEICRMAVVNEAFFATMPQVREYSRQRGEEDWPDDDEEARLHLARHLVAEHDISVAFWHVGDDKTIDYLTIKGDERLRARMAGDEPAPAGTVRLITKHASLTAIPCRDRSHALTVRDALVSTPSRWRKTA